MPYDKRSLLMSDKFNQLIELLIAEDSEKARELFHDIVVERSRSIYESLIDDETVDEAVEEEAVEESDFDEELGGDAADDMIADIEADEHGLAQEADHEEDEDIEDRVVDLEDALDELKAEFDRLMGDEEAEAGDMDMDAEVDMDMGDEEAEEEEDEEEEMESVAFEADEVVREYKENAPAPVTAEQGDGKAGPVAKKNNMGGKAVDPTGEEKGGAAPKATVQTDAADPKGATMKKA
jgi:beta-galactosidase GanA